MCYDELAAAVVVVYYIKCGGALNMCRATAAEWRSALPLVGVCTEIEMGAVFLFSASWRNAAGRCLAIRIVLHSVKL